MASSIDQDATQESENRLQNESQGDGMHGLQVGDMVWGKVKSHPWWPGHIFNESFAGGSVRKTRLAEGRKPNSVLVAFFGDSSYGWFDPTELVPFSPNFSEMSTQANYKSFINAVSEASDEVSRRGALAVTCKCRDQSNFCPTGVDDYVFVDVPGYERGGIYSLRQIGEARQMFDPVKDVRFIKDIALGATDAAATYSQGEDVVTFMKMRAMMVGYRRAVFEERDETYAQAFGVDPAKIDRTAGSGVHLQKKQERFTQRGIDTKINLCFSNLLIQVICRYFKKMLVKTLKLNTNIFVINVVDIWLTPLCMRYVIIIKISLEGFRNCWICLATSAS
jgi:PWWP domain